MAAHQDTFRTAPGIVVRPQSFIPETGLCEFAPKPIDGGGETTSD
jgi:hypothetical protein